MVFLSRYRTTPWRVAILADTLLHRARRAGNPGMARKMTAALPKADLCAVDHIDHAPYERAGVFGLVEAACLREVGGGGYR